MSLAIHPSAANQIPQLTDEFRLAALAPRPQELAATGLDERLLADLTAKHLHGAGTLTLAQTVGASRTQRPDRRAGASVHARPKVESRCVRASASTLSLRYALTDSGRASAQTPCCDPVTSGPAPVPLAFYERIVRAQTIHDRLVSRQAMRDGYRDVVVIARNSSTSSARR